MAFCPGDRNGVFTAEKPKTMIVPGGGKGNLRFEEHVNGSCRDCARLGIMDARADQQSMHPVSRRCTDIGCYVSVALGEARMLNVDHRPGLSYRGSIHMPEVEYRKQTNLMCNRCDSAQ